MNGIGLGGFGVPLQQADYVATDAQTTGNFLVLLVEGAEDAGLEELQRATGAEFVNTADTSIGALEAVELQEAGAVEAIKTPSSTWSAAFRPRPPPSVPLG
jgi:hypothetical protein